MRADFSDNRRKGLCRYTTNGVPAEFAGSGNFGYADGICTYILEYDNNLRCVAMDDTWAGPAKEGCPGENYIRWRIEGTNGLAIGDIGWCKEPFTSPSTLRYASKGDAAFHEPRW